MYVLLVIPELGLLCFDNPSHYDAYSKDPHGQISSCGVKSSIMRVWCNLTACTKLAAGKGWQKVVSDMTVQDEKLQDYNGKG